MWRMNEVIPLVLSSELIRPSPLTCNTKGAKFLPTSHNKGVHPHQWFEGSLKRSTKCQQMYQSS